MTRRRAAPLQQSPAAAPLDEAMLADEASIAAELEGILEATRGFEISQIKGAVFQKPANGQGAWAWCDEVFPPWNLSILFADMRERYGAGFYQLRITAGGKIRKNVDFAIANVKSPPPQPAVTSNMGGNFTELVMMMMTQQNAAADRQMTMMANLSKSNTDMLAAILPAMAGGRNEGSSTAETIALITALGTGKGGGLKDTLEAMAAFKQLMGGGDRDDDQAGGFDADDIIGSGARLIGPAVKALGDYVAKQRGQGGEAAGSSASGPAGGEAPAGPLALGPAVSRFRLIELVKVDVTYGFQRGHDPEKIADLVYDVIEANNVTEAEINELAAAFALSPTGLDDLAREGIDLRERPQWAAEFFAALSAIHTGQDDSGGGGEGRAGDPAANGGAGPAGDA